MTPSEAGECEEGYTVDGRPKNPDAGIYVSRCLTHDRPFETCALLARLAEAEALIRDAIGQFDPNNEYSPYLGAEWNDRAEAFLRGKA